MQTCIMTLYSSCDYLYAGFVSCQPAMAGERPFNQANP